MSGGVRPPGTAAPTARPAQRRLWLTGGAFLLSGAAGLVYQIAWQRILALHSGVGIYSVAMIVAAFMAGLGAGNYGGGVLSARLTARRALHAFLVVEGSIAAFGVLSCPLYYDVLYVRAAWLYATPWRAGLMHFAALFVPTVLMGMSLPLLSRAFVREARTAGGTIGFLYGINLVGAGLGALATPWFLIRFWGIRGAVFAAAAANAGAVLLASVATLAFPPDESGSGTESHVVADDPASEHPLAFWVTLYALSGFCALSLEILWFRLLDLAVRSRAFTFGTLLGVYLLGSALGCLVAAARVLRLMRPLRVFLLSQCLLLLYAGVAVLAIAWIPPDAPVYRWLFRYWMEGNGLAPLDAPLPQVIGLYIGVPLLLFGPATVLMGVSFPALQRAVQDDPRTSGLKAGILQAANITGCVAGSLLVGLLVLQLFGTAGALRLVLLTGVVFPVLGARAYGVKSVFSYAAAALLLLALVVPSQQRLWSRLHGTEDPRALVDEDASGVGALVPLGESWAVYVDGKAYSWLPFGGPHTLLGALPALIHPSPADLAIIGLGSGDTAWAAACREETRTVTVFEIAGSQPRLLRRVAAAHDIPDLRALLADPRLRLEAADGRNAITQRGRLYDLIEADALWPDVTYAGNVYSTEFFRQCAGRLKPGGVLCTWAPTRRAYASFISVMPHVVGTHDRSILIGSRDPLRVDIETWRARLHSAAVERYLGPARVAEVESELGRMVEWNVRRRRPGPDEVDRDLFPRDEFATPQ